MDLCDDDHPQVCFEANQCPVCESRSEMQDVIDEKDEEIKGLTDERDALASDLEAAEEELQQYSSLKEKLDTMVKERI